jgi:hypothetical protein
MGPEEKKRRLYEPNEGTFQPAPSIREEDSWSLLPTEIHQHIFTFLGVKDLCRAMRVSKLWRTVCLDDSFWHSLFISQYGQPNSDFSSLTPAYNAPPSISSSSTMSSWREKYLWVRAKRHLGRGLPRYSAYYQLVWAIQQEGGYLGVVEQLLRPPSALTDADCARGSLHGLTPLHLAAQMGNPAMVSVLLRGHRGFLANIDNSANDFGLTPLFIAADAGHVGVVDVLVVAGASVNCAAPSSGATPLMLAAGRGAIPLANSLLCKRNFAPAARAKDASDRNGNTALMVAAAAGHVDMIDLLVASFGSATLSKTNDE